MKASSEGELGGRGVFCSIYTVSGKSHDNTLLIGFNKRRVEKQTCASQRVLI